MQFSLEELRRYFAGHGKKVDELGTVTSGDFAWLLDRTPGAISQWMNGKEGQPAKLQTSLRRKEGSKRIRIHLLEGIAEADAALSTGQQIGQSGVYFTDAVAAKINAWRTAAATQSDYHPQNPTEPEAPAAQSHQHPADLLALDPQATPAPSETPAEATQDSQTAQVIVASDRAKQVDQHRKEIQLLNERLKLERDKGNFILVSEHQAAVQAVCVAMIESLSTLHRDIKIANPAIDKKKLKTVFRDYQRRLSEQLLEKANGPIDPQAPQDPPAPQEPQEAEDPVVESENPPSTGMIEEKD